MTDERKKLGNKLRAIDGVKKVYFQPPESVKLVYPCILYFFSSAETRYGNNFPYNFKPGFTVIIIDHNPDSSIPSEVAKMKGAKFDRHYVRDNLHHFVFRIYQ